MKKERDDEREEVGASLTVRDQISTKTEIPDTRSSESLVRESLRLMNTSTKAVQKILPAADSGLVGGFFANLLDLWETGQRLDKELQKIARFQEPHDRAQLRELLIWTSAIQVDMASYWIGEVKKDIPKLLQELDKLEG